MGISARIASSNTIGIPSVRELSTNTSKALNSEAASRTRPCHCINELMPSVVARSLRGSRHGPSPTNTAFIRVLRSAALGRACPTLSRCSFVRPNQWQSPRQRVRGDVVLRYVTRSRVEGRWHSEIDWITLSRNACLPEAVNNGSRHGDDRVELTEGADLDPFIRSVLDIATCKTMYCGYSRHVQANRGDGPHDVATITMSVDNIRLCRQTERAQDAPFTHIQILAPTRTTALSTPSQASVCGRNGWSSLSSWPIAAATVTRCPAACCERARGTGQHFQAHRHGPAT